MCRALRQRDVPCLKVVAALDQSYHDTGRRKLNKMTAAITSSTRIATSTIDALSIKSKSLLAALAINID